eukprot:TRINITY_DN6104_c0_g1_i1.p1 TRINITY_DN6104_c0_g1~~TRINITY_DN6104_c0_g1_i1.p1  ORF type:complete len:415 (+),score=38.45 TRINITY_DN6104_c0_g1_i1:239-1483(+)
MMKPSSSTPSSLLLCLCSLLLLVRGVHSLQADIDPDAYRTFTQIVQSKGYPCEEHFVTTYDGYILRLFRIPSGRNNTFVDSVFSENEMAANSSRVVFLQHGLLDSSFTWILNEPNESLSYILADAGYDVWMGNNRGNTYSKNHTKYSPSDHEFWQFSWDEMAWYDFPNMIDYVLSYTNSSKLAYIGHSEGTIQAFSGLVVTPGIADKLSIYIGYGPVATVSHIGNIPLKSLADFHVDTFVHLFGMDQFMPTPTQLKGLFVDFCNDCGTCCEDVIEAICGPHKAAFNESRMPVMASHEPGGTSVQNMQHWCQAIRDGRFQMYDYGLLGNMEHYHQDTPPVYDLTKFPPQLPVALFSGSLGDLANPTDVNMLIAQLPNVVYWEEIPLYAHLDFCWDYTANQNLYPKTIKFLKQYHS